MNTKIEKKSAKWKTEGVQAFLILFEIIVSLAVYYFYHFGESKSDVMFFIIVGIANFAVIIFSKKKLWPRVMLAEICLFTILNIALLPRQNSGAIWNIKRNGTTTFLESAEKSPEQWINQNGCLMALMNHTIAEKTIVINSENIKNYFYNFEQYFIPKSMAKDFSISTESLELSDLKDNFEIINFELSHAQGTWSVWYINSANIKNSEVVYILYKDGITVIITAEDFEQWKEL